MNQVKGHVLIVRGEDYGKALKIRTNGGVDPVDLSGAAEIEIAFPMDDGTFHKSTLTSYDPDTAPDSNGEVTYLNGADGSDGNLMLNLSAAVTALLKDGEGQNIEISWSISSKETKLILPKVLEVQVPDAG